MYARLDDYIRWLEEAGELIRVKTRVDTTLEIAEITDRMAKQSGGGKAVLFENTPEGFPVLTNMMGSGRRMAMALGVESVDEFTGRIDALFSKVLSPKKNLFDKLKLMPLMAEAARWFPRSKGGRAECQEVVWMGEEADLSRLPILRCWPYDGGRFVTLPLVHTVDPESGSRNVGMYRMQVFDGHSTGMHWHLHKTGERHYRDYKERGIERMPVSVAIGGDPAYTYAATAPLPDGLDEYLLAGFIRNKPVEMVKCLTNEIEVPADCDFVIEGYVDTTEEKVVEGPFGDHTGFYSLDDRYPVFHVTCITHRKGAVYPATIVGVPPQEDMYIARATERIFLSPIRNIMQPEIRDMRLPWQGTGHNFALIDIEKSYEGQAAKVANALWGAGQMMFNKFMVVTSSGLSEDALKEAVSGIDVSRDVIYSKGPLDVLDHTASVMGFGGKLAIDATNEPVKAKFDASPDFLLPDGVKEMKVLPEWAAVCVAANDKACFKAMTESLLKGFEGVKFLLFFDKLADSDDLLWLLGANADAVRDTAVIDGCLALDARVKAGGLNGFTRPWPNVVTMDVATIELVDSRWESYGLGGFIESPSRKYQRFVKNEGAEVKVK